MSRPEPPIRAVFFDLDGTLFDHAASARSGVRALLAGWGVTPDQQFESTWKELEDVHFRSYLGGTLTFEQQRRARIRAFLDAAGRPSELTDRDADDVFAGYLEAYETSWSAFPDAQPALERLQTAGIPAGIITNGTDRQQRAKLEAIGLSGLLDPVFTSEGLGHAKPDARAFAAAVAGIGIEPGEVLYIGDTYDVDVLGARRAGLQAKHLNRIGPAAVGDLTSLAGWPGGTLAS